MTDANWGIIGNERAVRHLQTALDNNRLAHAYLFLGKEHVGKRALADALVRTLLGSTPQMLKQLEHGVHPDVVVLERDPEKKSISIEQVRELQEMLSMSSFLNTYKVAIIEDADCLSDGAANALLKVLEEPAQKTIILLLAHSGSRLLQTIVSRCQIIHCAPVSNRCIEQALLDRGVTRVQSELCAAMAHGCPGTAVRFVEDTEALRLAQAAEELYTRLQTQRPHERFSELELYLNAQKRTVGEISGLLDSWIIAARKLLLGNLASPQALRTGHHIEALFTAKELLSANANQKLVLEHLVLQF